MSGAEFRESVYTTLVQVVGVHRKRDQFDVVVPGWDPDRKVTIPTVRAEGIVGQIKKGRFFLANVNLAAEEPEQLLIHGFQLAPPPVSERELVHFPSS